MTPSSFLLADASAAPASPADASPKPPDSSQTMAAAQPQAVDEVVAESSQSGPDGAPSGGSSQELADEGRRPSRAAAEASKHKMQQQARQEEAPEGVVIATTGYDVKPQHLAKKTEQETTEQRGTSAKDSEDEVVQAQKAPVAVVLTPCEGGEQILPQNDVVERKRPSRAAAEASREKMYQQVKQEEVPEGVVIATTGFKEQPQQLSTKKETRETVGEVQRTRPSRAAAEASREKIHQWTQQEKARVVIASVEEEEKPQHLSMKNVSKKHDREEVEVKQDTEHRRPSRAAAEASRANMLRVAQQEKAPIGVIIVGADSEDKEAPQHLSSKKRPTTAAASEDTKRSRVGTGIARKAPQNTLEMASAGSSARGKKRRPAPEFEPSPIITDVPPLPFTVSPKGKGKQNKAKHKGFAAEQVPDDGSRSCEYCKKVANMCALMHCTACRRVYHAECLVGTFKPFVQEKVPVEDQIERLQLEAPDRRGGIFRCISCKAAFMDFYEGGGHLWGCSCPTCAQPEKTVYYRQRKLVRIMNEMEEERKRKKEKKSGKTVATPAKPAPPASRSNSRSRRGRSSSTAPEEPAMTSEPKTETVVQEEQAVQEIAPKPMDAVESEIGDDGTGNMGKEAAEPTNTGASSTAEPPQHPATDPLNQLSVSSVQSAEDSAPPVLESKLPFEELEQPELQGDDLIAAVLLRRENNNDWSFPVMCSRTANLRESGVMKTGTYVWHYKRHPVIQCQCCDKEFRTAEFVHHTDSSLVKDPKSSDEDPTPFLFVEHRDGQHFTPLDKFLAVWRFHHAKQVKLKTSATTRSGHVVKQETITAVVSPSTTTAETSVDTIPIILARLRTLAVYRRPRRNGKFTMPVDSSDPPSMEFVAKVVCLPQRFVMTLLDGSLADRIARSDEQATDTMYPRKFGWLTLSREPKRMSRVISCTCCNRNFSFEEFLKHAEIENEKMKNPRQFLYVVGREDESKLVELQKLAMDMTAAATHNELAPFLKKLRLPPTAP